MNDDIRLFYDLTAKLTADQWYEEEMLKPTIDDFIKLLPPNPRVLDLGCGPGHESMRLAATGATVLGVDFSEECIKIARERSPQCRFEVMDFKRLDEKNGQFDGVFACASIIHINPRELPGVMQNIRGALKKNGYAALIVQDGAGVKEEWSLLEVEGKKLQRTVYCYKKEHLNSVAEPAGLSFFRYGHLERGLMEEGWVNYIFKRN